MFVFGLQLVAMPLLITLAGPAQGVLPSLPSHFAINLAIILDSLAFLTVCAVYNHLAKSQKNDALARSNRLRNAPDARRSSSTSRIAFLAILGVLGVFLSFGNTAGILDFFNNPAYYRDLFLEASSTWQGLAALLLKPFLGFAVILAWCKWIDSRGRKAPWWRRGTVTLLVFAGVVLSFSLVGYNRGAFAVPLVALATVPLAKGDKFIWRLTVTAGLLLLLLLPVYAIYRSGTELGGDLLANTDIKELLVEKTDYSDIVQMYGSAPQYLGTLLEGTRWGSNPHWGAVTLSSILSPVPVLGKRFRQGSGFSIYNHLIYGTDRIADQNAPFVGELFLDFQIAGILLGYAILGGVLYRIQRAFERSQSSIEVYIWQFFSIWICFVIFGGIEVPSQILIYSCWPIYAFWYLNRKPHRDFKYRAITIQEA